MPDRIENGIGYFNGLKVGDIYGSNYIEISNAGVLTFKGTAHISDESGTADIFASIAVGGATNKASISSVGKLSFAGTNVNSIDFSGVTPSTNTDGWLISSGSTWVMGATAGACAVKLLCGSTATTGDYATLRLRARAGAAWTGGADGGIVCGNFSASANINDYGNLYAVQGYAQPGAFTQASASNIICGVYSCVDRTGSSVGRSWSTWIDDHSNAKASAGHYLLRMSNNSTNSTQYDGFMTLYAGAGCAYLFNIEGSNAPYAANSHSIDSHALNAILTVNTPAGVGYIPVLAAVPA